MLPPSVAIAFAAVFILGAAGSVSPQQTKIPSVAGSDEPTAAELPTEITRLRIPVGKQTFDALAAGPETGELVLLLHGFPQTSYSYRHQLVALGRAGLRAIAIDQRGYSPDARPEGVEAYALDALAGDVLGVADAVQRDSFHLVGHDWGAAVAWVVAGQNADRVKTVTALSTPHIGAFMEALNDPFSEQTRRSAYFALFSSKGAERTFLANDCRLFRGLFKGSGLTEAEVQVYVDALGTPEAMRAALNWYRAMMLDRTAKSPRLPGPKKIVVPTLYIFSTEDPSMSREAADATRDWVTGPYRFEVLEGFGHWLPEQAAAKVTELILNHVREE